MLIIVKKLVLVLIISFLTIITNKKDEFILSPKFLNFIINASLPFEHCYISII